MQVEFLQRGGRLIARLTGRMEASDGDLMVSETIARLGADMTGATIDLDHLDCINFGAIRALLRLARALKDGDRNIDFTGGNDSVRYTLDQAGLDDFFAFTPPYVSNRGKSHEA